MDPRETIPLDNFLGLDRRGNSAFNFYKKSIAQKNNSPGTRNHLNTSHVKRRVNFHSFEEAEKYLKVGNPRNRPTIFARPGGDYNGAPQINGPSDYEDSHNASPYSTTSTSMVPRIPKS